MEKRYLVEYNYMLLANQHISYRGRFVGGVSVSVRFHKLNKAGQEVYLEIPPIAKKGMLPIDPGLSDFMRVSVSKEDGILLVPNVEKLYKHYTLKGERICYRVVKYWIEYENPDQDNYASDSVTKEEFDNFVMNHFDRFDIFDNDKAQCVAYDITYIKDPYVKERYFVGWDTRGNPCIVNNAKELSKFYSNARSREDAEKRLSELKVQMQQFANVKTNLKGKR